MQRPGSVQPGRTTRSLPSRQQSPPSSADSASLSRDTGGWYGFNVPIDFPSNRSASAHARWERSRTASPAVSPHRLARAPILGPKGQIVQTPFQFDGVGTTAPARKTGARVADTGASGQSTGARVERSGARGKTDGAS